MLGDTFSGWLSIYTAGHGEFDAKSLVKKTREYFTTLNIPEELATDGGPQMTSTIFQNSLKAWEVRHRLSAAYNPHSNCRAELAVKVGKKLLRDNTGPGGSLDNDRFMRAIMQFRNTPMQDCRRSPAQMVFGRPMRDFLPNMVHKYEPAKDWSVTQEYRERTLAMKRESDDKRWSQRTRDLEDLPVGTLVSLQNQTGNHPNKWEKTGIVLENKPHSQVVIRVDGSRRVTTRNRRFVRPLHPALRREVTPKPVMRKEKRRDTTQDQPVHEAPAVVRVPVPAGDRQVQDDDHQNGVEDHHVHPVQEMVGHGDHDSIPVVVEAPLVGSVPQVPESVPLTGNTASHEEGPRPKRSPKPNSKYSPEVYDLSYVGKRTRSRRSIRRAGT